VIKEQIDQLNKELRNLLRGTPSAPSSRTTQRKKRTMSAEVKKKIAVAQKARWAKIKRA
jgi:hypothetical protein